MIQVQEINAFSDNYIWCLYDENKNALVVDPGCAKSVEKFLLDNELKLKAILVTHHHPDHVGGVKKLKTEHDCKVYAFKDANFSFVDFELLDQQKFTVLDTEFKVICVPGHTLDHIAFYTELCTLKNDIRQPSLFCGDTLFSAGCGRLFEGTPEQMLESLNKLVTLPESTLVYCAHEYTLSNLKFAKTLMPNNADLASYIKECEQKRKSNIPTIPSTIATELKINPFLRSDDEEIYQSLVKANLINNYSPLGVFTAVRKAKDNF